MRRRYWREQFENGIIAAGLFVVVGCLRSAPAPPIRHPGGLATVPPLCAGDPAPTLLCNRTTKTSPRYECAICADPARACLTATSIYCATSCDEPLCGAR